MADCLETTDQSLLANARKGIGMYLLKTGSPLHMRALRVFEPMMVLAGIITLFATVPPFTSYMSLTASMHPVCR